MCTVIKCKTYFKWQWINLFILFKTFHMLNNTDVEKWLPNIIKKIEFHNIFYCKSIKL